MQSLEPLTHFERFGLKPTPLSTEQLGALDDFRQILILALRYRNAFFDSDHLAHKPVTQHFFKEVDLELENTGLPRFEVIDKRLVPNSAVCRTIELLNQLYPGRYDLGNPSWIVEGHVCYVTAQTLCNQLIDAQIKRMQGYLRLFDPGFMLYGTYSLQGFEPA